MSLPHSFRIGRAGADGAGVVESLGSNGAAHPSGGVVINDGFGLAFYQSYNTDTHDSGATNYNFTLSGDTTMTISAIAGGGGGGSFSDNVNGGDRTGVNPVTDNSRGGTTAVTIGGSQVAVAQGGFAGFSRGVAFPDNLGPQLSNPAVSTGPRSGSPFSPFPGGQGGNGPDVGSGASPLNDGSNGAGGGGGGGVSSIGFGGTGGTAQMNTTQYNPGSISIKGANGGRGIDGNQYSTSAQTPGYNTSPYPASPIGFRGGGGGAGHRSEGGYGGAGYTSVNPYTSGETVSVQVGRGGRGFQRNQGSVRPGSAPTAYGDFGNGVGGHGAVIITWPAP